MPGRTPHSQHPEVVFRGLLPSEALLALVREQDALLREVVATVPRVRRALLVQEPRRAGYRVEVSSELHGRLLLGQAEHPRADVAVRRAYSELLRQLASTPLAA